MAPQTQMHDDIFSLASNNETVKLNVGGKRYETSWAVISSVEKLSALAYESWVEDPEDEIFIDRDGIRFRYCLDFFRDGKVVIPRNETKESILIDLKYFGVASPDTDAIQYAEDFDDGSKENNLPLKDNPPATQAIKFIFNLDNEVNRCSSKHSSLVFVQAVVKYLLSSTKENSFTETRTLTLSNFGSTANATLYAQAAKVHNEMNGAKTPTKEDLIEDFYSHAGLKFVSIHCGVDGQGSCSYVIKFEKE